MLGRGWSGAMDWGHGEGSWSGVMERGRRLLYSGEYEVGTQSTLKVCVKVSTVRYLKCSLVWTYKCIVAIDPSWWTH